jgi:hypothetical protein
MTDHPGSGNTGSSSHGSAAAATGREDQTIYHWEITSERGLATAEHDQRRADLAREYEHEATRLNPILRRVLQTRRVRSLVLGWFDFMLRLEQLWLTVLLILPLLFYALVTVLPYLVLNSLSRLFGADVLYWTCVSVAAASLAGAGIVLLVRLWQWSTGQGFVGIVRDGKLLACVLVATCTLTEVIASPASALRSSFTGSTDSIAQWGMYLSKQYFDLLLPVVSTLAFESLGLDIEPSAMWADAITQLFTLTLAVGLVHIVTRVLVHNYIVSKTDFCGTERELHEHLGLVIRARVQRTGMIVPVADAGFMHVGVPRSLEGWLTPSGSSRQDAKR